MPSRRYKIKNRAIRERTFSQKLFNYPRYGVEGWTRWLPSLRLTVVSFFSFTILSLFAFSVAYSIIQIPPVHKSSLSQSVNYYYADNTLLASYGVNRSNVDLKSVPSDLINAVITAENQDFYKDKGISIKGISRAFLYNLLSLRIVGGGSTITQQYVKDAYLTQKKSFSRKLKETIITIKLSKSSSKDFILTNYLNTIFFGRNSFGVAAAAKSYFNKDIKNLTPAESIFIASVIPRPSYFQNYEQNEKAKAILLNKWNSVRTRMVKLNYLSQEESDKLVFPSTIPYSQSIAQQNRKANPDLVEAVDYLIKNNIKDGDEHLSNVKKYGGKVYTTLDPASIKAAEDAANKAIFSKLKSGKDNGVTTAIVDINPKDGSIRTLYGGNKNDSSMYWLPVKARKQPGSTFKVFTLTAAFDTGRWNADSTFSGANNIPVSFPNQPVYIVRNDNNKSYGTMTLRDATVHSVNSVYVQLAKAVTNQAILQTATEMGMPEKYIKSVSNKPSFTLGSAIVTPLSLASSYATLANDGVYNEPYIVKSMTYQVDKSKVTAYTHKDKPERKISSTTVAEVNEVLHDVVENGEGPGMKYIHSDSFLSSRSLAGKTGTTNDAKNALFVGFSPYSSTAVVYYNEVVNPITHKIEEVSLSGVGGYSVFYGYTIPLLTWAYYNDDIQHTLPNEQLDFPKNNTSSSSRSSTTTDEYYTTTEPDTYTDTTDTGGHHRSKDVDNGYNTDF